MLDWLMKKVFGTAHEREVARHRPRVAAINELESRIAPLSDEELRAKTASFREQLDNGATLDDILIEAFAVCREAGKRTLRMRHFDVQLIGGMVLHGGSIAEMRTGEGKTLVATLPCYLNALEGKGVHVITVNDYLARRDAEWMGRLYHFLGLTTGVVVSQQSDREKRASYLADITYGQNNEFGFDYLRDNMKSSALEYMQRELNYAIVDEVDSILIDEARTPLIISGQAEASTHKYKSISEVIPRLRKDEHYVVDEKAHSVTLTDDGIDLAQKLLELNNLYDPVNLESLHVLNQCLRAHSLYHRDKDYLVAEGGKVLIIDTFTGRVLPGRRWSDGLHQAVEAKENVPIQEETRTMATITFQNLFRLYKKLSGMTGTADTEAEEFHSTYKLKVVAIPTNKPLSRVDHEDVVYKTEREKFTAVINELMEFHERGQPVLVGTTSVDKSAAISRILKKKGVPHTVLNAKHHENEAYVVAQAGRKGAITVATNMAGRGTDIILGGNAEMIARLEWKEHDRQPEDDLDAYREAVERHEAACKIEGDEIRALGGVHILGTERHESRRIDNQLRGRAGRQGDPGSSRFYLSLEDDLMRIFAGDKVKNLMEKMGMPDDEPIVHPWVTKSIQDAQQKVEGRNFDVRKHLLEYDNVMNEQRKTVYTIRQQLLLGRYFPEVLDEDGKPTGKLREITTLPRIEEETRDAVRELILHYAAPPAGYRTQGTNKPAPKTLEEVTELFELDSLRNDIYQFWGYRFDYRPSEATNAKLLVDRLVREIPHSLTEQRDRMLDLIDSVVGAIVEETCKENVQPEDWDWKELKTAALETFGVTLPDMSHMVDRSQVAQALYSAAETTLLEKEKEIGSELLIRAFRHFYFEEIDRQWVEHLTNMEHLRDGIGLRGYGQRDPKQEYKKEGYNIFVTMMATIQSTVVQKVYQVQIRRDDDIQELEQLDAERHRRQLAALQALHLGEEAGEDGADLSLPPPGRGRPTPSLPPPRQGPKIARNDLCPCGSGELFKKCHGAILEDDTAGGA